MYDIISAIYPNGLESTAKVSKLTDGRTNYDYTVPNHPDDEEHRQELLDMREEINKIKVRLGI